MADFDYDKQPTEWENQGVEPPLGLRNWQMREEPPAAWFNYFWDMVYKCFDNVKTFLNKFKSTTDGASGADLIGATAIPGLNGSSVQALLECLGTNSVYGTNQRAAVSWSGGVNTIIKSGFYYIFSNVINTPTTSNGMLLAIMADSSDDVSTQLFSPNGSSTLLYMRKKSTTWGAWAQIYDSNTIAATTDGASGADKVGATAITGLTGSTVQTLLESISTVMSNAGINDTAKSLTDTNLNNLITTGFFRGGGLTNAPGTASEYYYIICIKHAVGYYTQMAFSMGNTETVNKIYTRGCKGGVWSTWKSLITDEQLAQLQTTISGAIPQTAGWYRIASSQVDILRNHGTFEVDWSAAGAHGRLSLIASCFFGTSEGSILNQLSYSQFSNVGINKARLVYNATYTGNFAYLEIYSPGLYALPTVNVRMNSFIGWQLIAPTAVSDTVPNGYISRELVFSRGFATTDQIVVGYNPTLPLQVATKQYVDTCAYQPGDYKVSARDSCPGFLLCDGKAYSRTTYAALFGTIGTKYGAGDGSTTFNIPDRRGRTSIGVDTMGGAAAGRVMAASTVGAVGGEASHTLTIDELPFHQDTVKAYSQEQTGSGVLVGGSYDGGAEDGSQITVGVGGGVAHNNVQPFMADNWFIKY